MLKVLTVKNFALIDQLELQFLDGFNVLTGETGAGKSILIGAIGLTLGERATAEQIRFGAEQSIVEAYFYVDHPQINFLLAEAGIPRGEDNELIIARELNKEGRNVCRVNGRSIPLSLLREIGKYLVDLHGQHQHQSLLDSNTHLYLLDGYGDMKLKNAYNAYQLLFSQWEECRAELKKLGDTGPERERQLEFLQFQIHEIEQFNPDPVDEQVLEDRRQVLNNIERLLAASAEAHKDIFRGEELPSLLDRLQHHLASISMLAELDSNLKPLRSFLETASANLEEAGHGLRNYIDSLVFDPNELEQIQERMQGYRQLQRKYGPQTSSILDYCCRLKQQLTDLEQSREKAEKVKLQLSQLEAELQHAAERLTLCRQDAAQKLEISVKNSLKELDLGQACFGVDISSLPVLGPEGEDRVEFIFSANKGEPLKPLIKVISGGEMSRVMLALKSILAEQDSIPTLIFDEIDTGISGATVDAVAAKIAELSFEHQVIAVTHHPQIAACAGRHFLIYKRELDDRTYTKVKILQGEKQEYEVARLLDGKMSDLALKHAREMLKRVK